jgi:hypothetical protein
VIGDNKGLPASITGLFGAGLGLYARRFPFYALLALLALAVQFVVDVFVMLDTGLLIGLDIIVGAFLAASVSIGVAFDLAGKEADWSRIMTAASLRWGAVAVISLIGFFVCQLFVPYMTLPPSQTGFGLLLLPFIVLWGAVTIATVVAAIEPTKSRLTLPLVALGKGLGVSARFVNLGRLMVFSVLLTLPLIAEIFIGAYLTLHHTANVPFWSDVPIDMLTIGPIQALATVFYVDFLRRAGR